ncbi:MAG: hypothetical protein RSA49_00060 [Anaerovoracaceae bacterium]
MANKKKTEIVFTKEAAKKKYIDYQDVLEVILSSEAEYTDAEIKDRIKEFEKGKVK